MNRHVDAIEAFQQGRREEALGLLQELLDKQESSELWNDWATVQLAGGEAERAKAGFLRALQLDPQNYDAKVNLGLLLLNAGDQAVAMSLLQEALVTLPPAQQAAVRALLNHVSAPQALAGAGETAAHPATPQNRAAENQPESAKRASDSVSSRPARILVINDVLPYFHCSSADSRLAQILQNLRVQGHDVTFLARDGITRKKYEAALLEMGVRVYAGDAERMRTLGHETQPSSWSLPQVLREGEFEVAILAQNFARGVSIPEHYLDEIRRHSPGTRIVIAGDELHGRSAEQRAKVSGRIEDFELAQDWLQREQEAFEHADLVIVSRESDAATLRRSTRRLEVAVVPVACQAHAPAGSWEERRGVLLAANLDAESHRDGLVYSSEAMGNQLREALAWAVQLTPKPRADEPCSMMRVETMFSEALRGRTGEQRISRQIACYVRLAEQLLHDKKPGEAREQLRHVFGRLGGAVNPPQFRASVLALLKRCYRESGDTAMASRCAEEARRCVLSQDGAAIAGGAPSAARKGDPLISLIIPSYNRLPILKKCLAALEAQSLSRREFEAIVIDDGSSDGTEEWLRQYRAPFPLQSLRQKNSGTGAARRLGVAHARGEYLLLMNDDTIGDPDLLEQHLRVQRAYASERWAVLGNFEYPAAARQRALTHFFHVEPFMFPQVSMEEGCPYGYSHFITCNLSIRRDAVVQVGSFDPAYRLSEDTELGIRLYEGGYRVLYHPGAHAWHDHLPYTAGSLVRRAKVYGADYFYMFRRHPRVMKEWAMPVSLDGMDEQNAGRVQAYVEANRQQVKEALAALERWDVVDFEQLLAEQGDTASLVLSLLRQAVPAIHWFYLYETMLETMVRELGLAHFAPAGQLTMGASHNSPLRG